MDADVRNADRAWREQPDNERLVELAARARRRAALDLPFDLLARTKRWARLVEFVKRWYERPLASDDGVNPDELPREQDGRHRFPEALREWYQLVGNRGDVTSAFNFPVWPSWSLEVEDGYLVFYTENQGVTRWAFLEDDSAEDDPPVFSEDENEGWVREHDQLSEFLFAMAVFHVVLGRPNDSLRGAQTLSPPAVEALTRTYEPMTLPPWHWPKFPSRFHADDDTIVQVVADEEAHVVARTEAAWARLTATVSPFGEWERRGGVTGP